jgi:hypothetical protein
MLQHKQRAIKKHAERGKKATIKWLEMRKGSSYAMRRHTKHTHTHTQRALIHARPAKLRFTSLRTLLLSFFLLVFIF